MHSVQRGMRVAENRDMIIVYRDGPYAGQHDYLNPPPHRLPGIGAAGYYQRTKALDAQGRVIFEWIAHEAATPAFGVGR